MKVVTHNVLVTLGLSPTLSVVRTSLKDRPQIVAYQEFNPSHLHILDRLDDYTLCSSNARGLPVLLKKKYVRTIDLVKGFTLVPDFPGGRPTLATEVRFTNRYGTKIALLNTHPLAHHDRPAYKAAFKKALKKVEDWAAHAKAHGRVPIVTMDGNGADKLEGLINCWFANAKLPTGPGGMTIDCVWTTKKATSVSTFETPSDHNGVVATYDKI